LPMAARGWLVAWSSLAEVLASPRPREGKGTRERTARRERARGVSCEWGRRESTGAGRRRPGVGDVAWPWQKEAAWLTRLWRSWPPRPRGPRLALLGPPAGTRPWLARTPVCTVAFVRPTGFWIRFPFFHFSHTSQSSELCGCCSGRCSTMNFAMFT
jgi:hypothetical protein